ncbi:TetR/AcrR family transcriptional regulator [Sciscionella sediminilitoris]|uniref:TetR/AcrR family transcriptional regulator n=1 Tax=Sciscionella sediminilitoris TaxID=1445613 RepID=UPI0004DF38B9|nr:TetR/AcrR family transcriptional regulator [Sciscionella sp. SE31]
MSDVDVVPAELVRAAIRAAEASGQDVAEVSLPAVAAEAGISRSTLVRRLGGSRRALDAAVRAAGVDPGGREPVRERAIRAAAVLIGEQGLAATTLEAVARAAECSVHSLHVTFRGRDGLLAEVYESYTPLFDIEAILARSGEDLRQTVCAVYRAFVTGLTRQPRVAPALLADALSRPDGAAGRLIEQYFPRAMAGIGDWLREEMRAGRIGRRPLLPLLSQLLGPILLYLVSGRLLGSGPAAEGPELDQACVELAELFVRAVAPSGNTRGGS